MPLVYPTENDNTYPLRGTERVTKKWYEVMWLLYVNRVESNFGTIALIENSGTYFLRPRRTVYMPVPPTTTMYKKSPTPADHKYLQGDQDLFYSQQVVGYFLTLAPATTNDQLYHPPSRQCTNR